MVSQFKDMLNFNSIIVGVLFEQFYNSMRFHKQRLILS